MRYIALIVGCLVVFKSGPISIAGFLSLSDLACAINVGIFSAYFFAMLAQESKLPVIAISPVVLAPFLLIAFVALGHAVVSDFSGSDFSTAFTMILIFTSTYMAVQNNFFISRKNEYDVNILYYFSGIVIGLIVPFIINKIGAIPDSSVYFYPGGRYKGFMSHQNQIGIISTFCIAFFTVTKMKIINKILFISVSFIPLLLCTSKFNLAVSAGIVGFWALYSINTFNKMINIAFIAIFAATCYIYIDDIITGGIYILSIVNPEGAERLAAFAASPEDSEATTSRLFLWDQAWKIGSENLPFGIGPSAAPRHLMMLTHAHNAILNFYLIYGLFGVIYVFTVAAVILGVLLRSAYGSRSFAVSVASVAAFISSNVSDSFSNSTALPLLTALALAYSSLRRADFERRRRWRRSGSTSRIADSGSQLNGHSPLVD